MFWTNGPKIWEMKWYVKYYTPSQFYGISKESTIVVFCPCGSEQLCNSITWLKILKHSFSCWIQATAKSHDT